MFGWFQKTPLSRNFLGFCGPHGLMKSIEGDILFRGYSSIPHSELGGVSISPRGLWLGPSIIDQKFILEAYLTHPTRFLPSGPTYTQKAEAH